MAYKVMVSALNSKSSGLGSSSGQDRCVVFVGKTLSTQCLSLPGNINNGYQQTVRTNLTDTTLLTDIDTSLRWTPLEDGHQALVPARHFPVILNTVSKLYKLDTSLKDG